MIKVILELIRSDEDAAPRLRGEKIPKRAIIVVEGRNIAEVMKKTQEYYPMYTILTYEEINDGETD